MEVELAAPCMRRGYNSLSPCNGCSGAGEIEGIVIGLGIVCPADHPCSAARSLQSDTFHGRSYRWRQVEIKVAPYTGLGTYYQVVQFKAGEF